MDYLRKPYISCRVQNYADRTIPRFGKNEHITLELYYFHCLPVELRVDHKMLLYIYKALHGHSPRRQLRSSGKSMLVKKLGLRDTVPERYGMIYVMIV